MNVGPPGIRDDAEKATRFRNEETTDPLEELRLSREDRTIKGEEATAVHELPESSADPGGQSGGLVRS